MSPERREEGMRLLANLRARLTEVESHREASVVREFLLLIGVEIWRVRS